MKASFSLRWLKPRLQNSPAVHISCNTNYQDSFCSPNQSLKQRLETRQNHQMCFIFLLIIILQFQDYSLAGYNKSCNSYTDSLLFFWTTYIHNLFICFAMLTNYQNISQTNSCSVKLNQPF